MLFPSLGGYMLKNTKDIIFFWIFCPIIPMGAIRYSCPIRLVPTYILPAKDIRLLGKFQPDSFKTERLVWVESDGQTDMARSTRLVMLIKNIYSLWGRKRVLHCVANFWLKSIYPLQGYKNNNIQSMKSIYSLQGYKKNKNSPTM